MTYYYQPHTKDGGRYCFQFVCQSTSWGGGVPRSGLGGYPIPGLGGVPHPRSGWGVPHPRSGQGGGVPHPRSRQGGGGTPSQVWMGGTQGTWGTPQPGLDGLSPPGPGMGYPSPWTWDEVPPLDLGWERI